MTANSRETHTNNNHDKKNEMNACEYLRYFGSFCVINLLVLVAMIGVGNSWCVLKLHPAANFVMLFAALILLAYIEALHYGAVAIEKWDLSDVADQYPKIIRLQKLVDNTEKVRRFLCGRQFMVIFVVFLIAQLTILPDIPHDFAGMPETMVTVLVETGLPGVALTLTYGQLISQLFVEEFTLPFLNGPGCYAVTHFGLALEYSGITHFSHLLYMLGAHFTCGAEKRAQKEIDSSSDLVPRTTEDGEPVTRMEENCSAFDYFRYIWSTLVCMASLGVVLAGIGQGYYVLPLPVPVAYFLFFFAMIILFYLEGIMIAIVATQYYDKESFKSTFPRAYAIHELVNRPDNVKRFIIGRQFFTVLVVFMIAGCTTFVDWPAGDINKALFWTLIKSGLVGVLVVLSFGQLMPELLAAEYPLRFMDMPGSYSIVWCSLFFDQCAVGHAAWAVYYGIRPFTCKKSMEEESAAEEKPDVIREPSAELLAATGSPWGESPPPRAIPTV